MCFHVHVYVMVLRQAYSASCCGQEDELEHLHTSFNPPLYILHMYNSNIYIYVNNTVISGVECGHQLRKYSTLY